MQNHKNTLLFVVNTPDFFLSHRLPLAVAAKKAGFEVHVASANGPSVQIILSYGFEHHFVPFTRKGQNPLSDMVTLFSLVTLFRRVKPALIHLITIKPVLYGGIAARLVGISSVICAVSGLGTVFLADSPFAIIRRNLVLRLYRAAFKPKRIVVIFQNPDDRDVLLRFNSLKAEQARLIRGSGVALTDYSFLPEPEGKPVVVMASRLLRDKGVFEFVEAARLLNARGLSIEMRLIGALDPDNPTSVTQQELDQWTEEGIIQLIGFRNDIAAEYGASNIVCLPSYREGLPKSLVEAAACGRAVVTTNVPGCRDAIVSGETGLLVNVKDALSLADGIQTLIEDPNYRRKMGQAGRVLAEEAFAIEKIVDQHMKIYKEMC